MEDFILKNEIKRLKRRVEVLEKVNSELINEVKKYKYDALTGFKLRIDFNDRMKDLFFSFNNRYTQMHNKELTTKRLIVVDINRLHYINNKYDYVAGDKYLTSISKLIVRKYPDGEFFRIGGDEFAVLTNNEAIPDIRNTSSVSLPIHDFNSLEELMVKASELLKKEKREWYMKHKLERRG